MKWSTWPYWLRGGVIGGGVAGAFYLLAYSCFWLIAYNSTPGHIGSSYNCLIFFIAGPAYPVGLLLNSLAPFFNYSWTFGGAYAPILSIPIWFIIGALIGAAIGQLKSRKELAQ